MKNRRSVLKQVALGLVFALSISFAFDNKEAGAFYAPEDCWICTGQLDCQKTTSVGQNECAAGWDWEFGPWCTLSGDTCVGNP